MRSRSALLTACSCALLAAGCGGGAHRAGPPPKPPRLPAELAQQLAGDADQVAKAPAQSCEARDAANRLQAHVIAAIRARRVPGPLLEPLSTTANDLVDRLRTCKEPRQEPGKPPKHGKKKHKREHD